MGHSKQSWVVSDSTLALDRMEIRAVGMDSVTSEFAEYDLNEIGKDFISSRLDQRASE